MCKQNLVLTSRPIKKLTFNRATWSYNYILSSKGGICLIMLLYSLLVSIYENAIDDNDKHMYKFKWQQMNVNIIPHRMLL